LALLGGGKSNTPPAEQVPLFSIQSPLFLGGEAMKSIRFVYLFVILGSAMLAAQSNPVPLINQPLVPASTTPEGQGFVLTVNGTGFVSGAVVNWNGSPRTTNFVSDSQLTAMILASDITMLGTASIQVVNPDPGAASNVVFFPITIPTAST
jgi:hypothetical protein